MKNILLSCFLLMCLCCTKYSDINGHWHIQRENSFDTSYLVMQIENDTIVSLGDYSIYGDEKGSHNLVQHKLNFPGECKMFHFTYELVQGKLELTNHLENWVGTKCDWLCCDKLRDFKNNLRLEINFPQISDKSKISKLNSIKQFESIVVGMPKDKMASCFNSIPVLELDGKMSQIEDLQYWIELKRKEFRIGSNKDAAIRIIADKNVQIEQLEEIVNQLNKFKIEESYLTYLDENYMKSKALFEYMKVSKIDFNRNGNIDELFK